VLADAMSRGEIIAMLRKGGIREQRAGFGVRHQRFLIYPTFFHESLDQLAPRFRDRAAAIVSERPPAGTLRLRLLVDVEAVWWVTSLDALRGIDGEHGLAWESVVSRFHYRGRLGLHVIAARVSRLAHEVAMPEERRYAGCVSWVRLESEVDVSGARPVITDVECNERVRTLRLTLGDPADESPVNAKGAT
jgi:hypothetical protein